MENSEKKFVNKETKIIKTIDKDGNKTFVGFFELAIEGLKAESSEGVTTGEIRDRIKLIDKIESVAIGSSITINESELKLIENSTPKKWKIVTKDIIDYEDHLISLGAKF